MLLAPLAPGERMFLGYEEWLISEDEARFVLDQGYAVVDGERQPVHYIATWEGVGVQVHVTGTGS